MTRRNHYREDRLREGWPLKPSLNEALLDIDIACRDLRDAIVKEMKPVIEVIEKINGAFTGKAAP